MFGKKMKEPVFLKNDNSAEIKIAKLNQIYSKVSKEDQREIEKELKLLNAGLYGENQIEYELKNSHTPMYVLKDLYLEKDGLTAQIDYMVVTRKLVFVIECKNMIGDIEIDNQGTFVRKLKINGKIIKEAIYSPITQNQRHLEMIKQIRLEAKNMISGFLFEKDFDEVYNSVVVLANAKTVLNAKYAKKEVKEKVIRADQLISYINEKNAESKKISSSDEEMKKLAEFYFSHHREKVDNCKDKYKIIDNVTKKKKKKRISKL